MLEIFSYTDADLSLDEATEAQLIADAQTGDTAAKSRLIEAYGPALRAAARNFGRGVVDGRSPYAGDYGMGNSEIDTDDLQSTALVGFLSLIEDHDPEKSPRLAGRVAPYLARFLADEFSAVSAFTVPTRTLSRFYGILKAAEGDAARAETLAGEYGMSVDVFRDVYAAVRGTGSLDAFEHEELTSGSSTSATASPVFTPSPVVDVEDRILVDMAFAAMDDDEARVCELYYGFTEYEPVPDAEIAHRTGASRPAVQRKRTKALKKSRLALGVALADGDVR